jgi:hypothetical protein
VLDRRFAGDANFDPAIIDASFGMLLNEPHNICDNRSITKIIIGIEKINQLSSCPLYTFIHRIEDAAIFF